MHRSRWAGIIIDCQTEDAAEAARFWSQALGMPVKTGEVTDRYVPLRTQPGEPHIEVQKVAHESRVHLDIETDDIDAEVVRLEALGAKRIAQVRTWTVMEAPTGQRFCVVRPQRPDFPGAANTWG